MKITQVKKIVNYENTEKKIKGQFNAKYLQGDNDSLNKLTALCIANEKLKTELNKIFTDLKYFDASKIKDKSIEGLKNNDKVKSFMNNYLEVSKKYYAMPELKDFQKALFSFSKLKNQVYLKPCFLFLLGLKKNPIHYLQMSFGLTATTSPKEKIKLQGKQKKTVTK